MLKNLNKNVLLQKLNVDCNKIHTIDYDHLSCLTNLKSLWINDNQLTDFVPILQSLPQLEDLYLANNLISSADLTTKHCHLKTLNLACNNLSSLKDI